MRKEISVEELMNDEKFLKDICILNAVSQAISIKMVRIGGLKKEIVEKRKLIREIADERKKLVEGAKPIEKRLQSRKKILLERKYKKS
jgi:hypothetical protein